MWFDEKNFKCLQILISGVSASKSAGIVGKWGSTSFTSIRSASISSEQVSRPKKFFKSKNTESDYDPIIQTQPVVQPSAPVPKAPSKFFKSKNVSAPPPQPVVAKPQPPPTVKPMMQVSKPLRPLEVQTNNQPPKVRNLNVTDCQLSESKLSESPLSKLYESQIPILRIPMSKSQ